MPYKNPTGKGIRSDAGGNGHYGAPRSKTVHGVKVRYEHKGTDYECEPGQDITAPMTCDVERESWPYADGEYGGLQLKGKRLILKVWYFEPDRSLIGKIVQIGDVIGKAQDISKRYPGTGVTPHVHVEVVRCDPEIFF